MPREAIPGSEAVYSCGAGFTLKGAAALYCKSGGEWDRDAPKCERKEAVLGSSKTSPGASCRHIAAARVSEKLASGPYWIDLSSKYKTAAVVQLYVGPSARAGVASGLGSGASRASLSMAAHLLLTRARAALLAPRAAHGAGTAT